MVRVHPDRPVGSADSQNSGEERMKVRTSELDGKGRGNSEVLKGQCRQPKLGGRTDESPDFTNREEARGKTPVLFIENRIKEKEMS